MDFKTRQEIEDAEREINVLKCDLASYNSDIGDYKITKTYEARLLGEEDPYDVKDLIAKRREARDRINQLQKKISALEAKK